MSSLTDKEFDDKLDQLLKESVGPSAAPADLSITVMPARPRFNWALRGIAATVVAGFGALLFWLIGAQPAETEAGSSTSGQDVWSLLTEGVFIGTQNLSSPTVLLYTAAIMGLIYIYLGRRIMRLYRLF